MSRKLRVGVVGVGNCASSLVQGLSFYRDTPANEPVPGLASVEVGGYHVAGHRDLGRLRRQRRQGRSRRFGSDLRPAEQHGALRRRRAGDRRAGGARRDAGRPRPLPPRGGGGGGRPVGRRRRGPGTLAHRRGGVLPAGRLAAGDGVVRGAGAERRLRLRQLHPGVHRLRPRLAEALRGAPPAAGGRRHQEPGRRHHRPPRAGQPLPRARRAAGPHLPAQFRRQRRFPEHAGAGTARIQEALQDPGGDQPVRRAARRQRRACRPERPRALARRPEIRPHPAGGHRLRRRCR